MKAAVEKAQAVQEKLKEKRVTLNDQKNVVIFEFETKNLVKLKEIEESIRSLVYVCLIQTRHTITQQPFLSGLPTSSGTEFESSLITGFSFITGSVGRDEGFSFVGWFVSTLF